ncbi:hypothetical protein [Nitrosopumilus sp.]|uniref:hypothetical protein n=1 Tax=Nitrosopumilus sp. TaxID=2024843 RepID=UPI003D12490C
MSLPEIQGVYSETYKRVLATGFFGSVQPFGLETFVYSTQNVIDRSLETEPISPQRATLKRIVECELIIDPMQMKSLHNWLGKKIKEYEKLFGSIPSPEEVQSRATRTDGQ